MIAQRSEAIEKALRSSLADKLAALVLKSDESYAKNAINILVRRTNYACNPYSAEGLERKNGT